MGASIRNQPLELRIFVVVVSVGLWETRSVFQGLWEDGGFPWPGRAMLGGWGLGRGRTCGELILRSSWPG